MAWQPQSFTPDPNNQPAASAWSPSSFVPDDEAADPHATGQDAALQDGTRPAALPPALPVQPPAQPQAAPPTSVSARFAMPATAVDPNAPVAPPAPPAAPANSEPSLAPPNNAAIEGSYGRFGDPNAIAYGQQVSAGRNADYSKMVDAINTAVAAQGGKFDASSGLPGFWRNASLTLDNSSAERARELQAANPDWDVKTITTPETGPMVVFKTPDSDTFHPIRGQDFNLAADTGHVAGYVPSAAANLLAGYATGGESFIPRVLGMGATGAAEQLAEREAKRAQGVNISSAKSDLGDAAESGLTNMAAETGASLISKAIRTGQGNARGLFNLAPDAQEAVDAQTALGAPALTLGQKQQELFGTREAQLAAISPYLKNNAYTPQIKFIADKLAAGGPGALSDADLQNVLGQMKADAGSLVNNPGVEATAGGQALQDAAQTQVKPALSTATQQAYKDAFGAGNGITFNPTPLQDAATNMETGIQARGMPQQADNGVSGVTSTAPQETTVTLGQTPAGSIPDIISKIKALNPDMAPVNGANPAQQLQALRTQLASAAAEYPAQGTLAAKAEWSQARNLLDTLDNKVLANPLGEGGETFSQKMAAARGAALQQNSTLDHPVMQDVLNSQTPEDLLGYAKPGNYTNLSTLKNTIGNVNPDAWKMYQDSYMTQLARQPDKIPKILDAFKTDPRSLDLLLSPDQQASLLKYSSAMDDIANSLPAKLRALPAAQDRATQALKLSDGTQLSDLINQVGGPQSAMGQNLRAGVRQSILESSLDAKTGKLVPAQAAKAISGALDSGQLNGVLLPAEVKDLSDLRTYANAITPKGSMQANLSAGETAHAAANPLEFRKFLNAWASIGFAGYESRRFANPGFSRFFIGAGAPPVAPVRAAGAIGGAVADQDRKQEPVPNGGN